MEPTFRTDEYRRRIPYSVVSPKAQQLLKMNDDKETPWWITNPMLNEGMMTLDDLRRDFPYLEDDDIIDAMVKARLSLYNEGPNYDKSKGWIERKRAIPQPHNTEFTIVDGVPTLTEYGKMLANEDMAGSYARSKEVEDWQKFPYKGVEFVRGTREEAGKDPWFRTMDEYSDAMLNTMGSQYSRALQDALQSKLYEILEEDLASENPRYLAAMKNKLLPDFDYSKGNPTVADFRNAQVETKKKPLKYMEFERPHRITTAAMSLGVPMWSATHFDPELNYNTSDMEAAARLGGDVLMNGLSFYAPIKGAQLGGQLGSRAVPYFRNVAGRAGAMAGGALGGAGTYLAERGADEALEATTGKGYHQYPMDIRDLGLQALLGGATGLPWRKAVPKYGELKQKIDPNFTSTVTRSDVADMIGAQKEAKKLIKQGKGKVGKEGIESKYQDRAWREYRKQYGDNEAAEFEHPPVIADEEGIKLVQNAPSGKVAQVRDSKGKSVRKGTMEDTGLLMEHDKAVFTDASGKPVSVDIPNSYGDANATLKKAYFEQNADYFKGMSPEAREDLWKAAKASREKDSEFSGLFNGKKEMLQIPTLREKMRVYGGRPMNEGERPMKNKGVEWLYRYKTKPGKNESGKFVEGDDEQKALFKKSKNTAHRRYGHNMLGEKELYEEPKASKGVSLAKGAGKLASLGNMVFHNVLPYSNLVGGVPPYTYEAYPDKEKK